MMARLLAFRHSAAFEAVAELSVADEHERSSSLSIALCEATGLSLG
jgi:hypothetical protein